MPRPIVILVALLLFVVAIWAIVMRLQRDARHSIELGQDWPPEEQLSLSQIDHSAWSELLGRYVDDSGLVKYRALKDSAEDRALLIGYLGQLSRADTDRPASQEERLAFWINAYNAVTLEGILREVPTSSIRNHTNVVGYNIWDHLLLQVGTQKVSLNIMEHEILRKMGEPRIHFAIVCASIGCPRLFNEAYVPERIDDQLTINARHFFAQTANFRIDDQAETVYLSTILQWFADDFGDTVADQLAMLAPYLPSDEAREQVAADGVRINYLDYDWSLNEQP